MAAKRIGSLALACPGQGILPQGCLHHLRKNQHLFSRHLECIDETLGTRFSPYLLGLSNPNDVWNLSTANAQPAILGATYIIADVFKQLHGIDLVARPSTSYLLGHSLGEYTALVLGGVVTLEDGIKLVRKRGCLMESLVGDSMDAEMHVLVFRAASFQRVLDVAAEAQVLACVNNETQISVSGNSKTLHDAVQRMNSPKKTILKQMKLPVKIPFHNKLLESVEGELKAVSLEPHRSVKPILCNVDGVARSLGVLEQTIAATSKPVEWKKSMDTLVAEGINTVLNLGPGNAVDAINSRFSIQSMPLKTEEDMAIIANLLAADDTIPRS